MRFIKNFDHNEPQSLKLMYAGDTILSIIDVLLMVCRKLFDTRY